MNLSSRTVAFAKKTIEFLSKTLDAWMSIQSQYLSHARVCFRGGFRDNLSHTFRSSRWFRGFSRPQRGLSRLSRLFFDNNLFDIILFYRI